jgi:hypothetical protein
MVSISDLAATTEFAAAVAAFDKDSISGIWEFEKFESMLSVEDWNSLQNWLLDGGPDQWTTNDSQVSDSAVNRSPPNGAVEQLLAYCRNKDIELPTICCVCNTPKKLLYCGNCRRAGYCSKECQRRDWTTHKHVCEKL